MLYLLKGNLNDLSFDKLCGSRIFESAKLFVTVMSVGEDKII